MKKRIGMLLCCLLLLLPWATPKAAAAASDSLTIRVGYFGGPYYEKKVMSIPELESLGATWQTFTFLDAGGFLAYAKAYGVALTDVLASAGVDIASVGTCHFKTSDSASYHTSITTNTLYGSQRYAFPALATYYGTPDGEMGSRITDYGAVWQSATPVQTVLSLQDNYARVDEFTPYDASCYAMQNGKRLRLFFGQTQPDEINARHMAYWVYGIDVEFSGAPSIQMQESEVSLSVGEDYAVEFSVSAADPTIAEAIRTGLRWESDNPAVVSVDQTGQLTVSDCGAATITAYYDDYEISASLQIAAGNQENLTGGGEGQGSGSGSGNGQGDGAGTGSGAASGTGYGGSGTDSVGAGMGSAGNPSQNNNTTLSTVQGDNLESTVVSKDKTEHTSVTLRGRRITMGNTGSANQSSGAAGREGGGAPVALTVQSNMLEMILFLAAFLLLLSGGASMWIKFKKEI